MTTSGIDYGTLIKLLFPKKKTLLSRITSGMDGKMRTASSLSRSGDTTCTYCK
jgi:hypothetical protein